MLALKKLYFKDEIDLLFDNMMIPHIHSLSKVDVDSSWFYDSHKHDNYCEIMFIVKGKGKYTIDCKQYLVGLGDLIVLNKDIVHAESSIPGESLIAWICSIENIKLKNFEENCILPYNKIPVIKTGILCADIDKCFSQIYKERINKNPHYDLIASLEVCKLIVFVQRLIKQTTMATLYKNTKSSSETIKIYIDKNYMHKLTLNTLAKQFHISKYHLIHEVKRDLGISPINYLIDRRIGEAQRLLLATNMSVISICQLVGYDNVSHFMNLFHKRIGISPTKFRNIYKIQEDL